MDDGAVFEAVEFCEPAMEPGQPFPGTSETLLGEYAEETEAIASGRAAWRSFRAAPTRDVMWWLVRRKGESMARWIADGRGDVERVLDLRTNQLIELR